MPAYIYEYTGGKAIIVASIFIPLELAFVCLRWYSRSLKRAESGIDDVLVWASLVVCIILNVYCIGISPGVPSFKMSSSVLTEYVQHW
jgi:FtsH-binding integral membrane protein